ncbi:hypothetical protein L227DRAFT_595003 [Lentinus tigrinus ALCF2SS1-6]|uniref:HNH nuclease domain-containing protein n=2 Tax=Lentinus tigrinus TaxID=5365 RepID=A0A5C2S0A8_9APHY|nr:hypothetical protein L227DRAFT_595003 [Lentinus tigrinus ALCF2SS1-6]
MRGDTTGQIYELGRLYMDRIIPLFQQHRPAAARQSTHPSRPSFDALRNDIVANMRPSPKDHKASKAQALLRDDFRCMVTGLVDIASYAARLVEGPRPTRTGRTECVHIFPESLGFLEGQDPEKKNFIATAYTMLNRFGYTDIQPELAGTKIHRLENVLTLATGMHEEFDQLNLWFEAVPDKPHAYCVITHDPFIPGWSVPQQVTFTSRYDIPLPSPRYLRIHAACCRIAHLSGAAEYIDKIYRDEEDLPVLAPDGASAPVLEHFLQRLVTRVDG